MLTPIPGRSARVSIADQTANPGQTVIAPVAFSSEGQTVSGIQLDLQTERGLSLRLLPGPQIGVSAKVLYSAILPNGALRAIIIGLNQTAIDDGDILRVIVSLDPDAGPGPAGILIRNTSMADHLGNPVVHQSVDATVQVQSLTAGPFVIPTTAVVNGASLLPGPICPGEVVTILGGPVLAATSSVLFNGLRAPILYAGPGQVNLVVPMRLDPAASVDFEIRSPAGFIGAARLGAAAASPAIFTQAGTGVGPGAVLNEDYSVNSYSNPAAPGSVVVVYGTGFGSLALPAIDGQTAESAAPTATTVSAKIAGMPAEVLYAGETPGLIAGVVQINVRIPHGLSPSATAPISLSIGPATTPAGATLSIQ